MTPYESYLSDPAMEMRDRVALLQEAVGSSVERRAGEDPNRANVHHMEQFLAFLEEKIQGDRFRAEVQKIPKALIRTTDRNFIVTVPGRSDDRLVLVAHYDTWAGLSRNAPGADDNTTGEEVLKQYLLRDLGSPDPPQLTHVYLFAGSEECGHRGLIAQLGLTIIFSLVAFGVTAARPIFFLAALPFLPLLKYRFGVTGTRHYVDSLSEKEKTSIRAAIAVDSVGDGRLYIPENEMGANFLRALLPYEGSEQLNDLLEEGAHLHHIKYNRFLAGGTTDSVVFLEERRFVPGGGTTHIPAAALITMSPGKCSPFVAGGKLHTSADTPDRVYAEPLAETLTVLDYAIANLEGSDRPTRPRELTEHHYARLYRDRDELFVAMKDAIEPNRRNINSIFRVEGELDGRKAELTAAEVVWWGVETSLDKEMKDFRRGARQVAVDSLEIRDDQSAVRFRSVPGLGRKLDAWLHLWVGRFQRLMGRYSFIAMFATALIVAWVPNRALEWALDRSEWFGDLFLDHYLWIVAAILAFELLVLFRIFTRELPSWMDNAYRHLNRADNRRSLRRSR